MGGSLLLFTTQSVAVTRRSMWRRPPINAKLPSGLSCEAPTFGRETEEEPSLCTTRPTADPARLVWDPAAQGEVIAYLIHAGAEPVAINKSGVAPLHRAVRTRSSTAVSTLFAHGADPRLANKSGSTPLHLAVQNTGKSNSGSKAAKNEQRLIVALLLEHGASPADVNDNGKTVAASASSPWNRQLLDIR
jgi:hypothetical protein